MQRDRCNGFNVYNAKQFYPIQFMMVQDFFGQNPDKIESILQLIANSTLVHMSNNLSNGYNIRKNSRVAYNILAEKYCPNVYKLVEESF